MMTDREEFEKFWESHRLYPDWNTTVWKAWQARGELDAVKIKELEDEIIGWQEKSIEREQHLQIANSAVEELTAKLDKAKEVLNMANWNQIGGYEGQQKWLELNRELDK